MKRTSNIQTSPFTHEPPLTLTLSTQHEKKKGIRSSATRVPRRPRQRALADQSENTPSRSCVA